VTAPSDEERAREIVERDDWSEWLGSGFYIKSETLAMHIAEALSAVRAEEREKAAKVADETLKCCPHGAFTECECKAAQDEIAAAIRRGA